MELVTFSSHKACIEKIISTRVYPFNLEFLRFVDPIGCTRIKFGQIEKKGFYTARTSIILYDIKSYTDNVLCDGIIITVDSRAGPS